LPPSANIELKDEQLKNLFRRPSFRNILGFDFIVVQGGGDVKAAETCPELFKIGRPVYTGADDILVMLPVTAGQAAGAGHVSVPVFVLNQGFQQFKYQVFILVEVYALGFL
jgi:hypothetical protein